MARRGVAMFQRTEIPVLGIVENMATYICPSCGHIEHIFGHGGARQEAEKLGVPFLGEVPPSTWRSARVRMPGRPVTAVEPESPYAIVYRGIASALWDNLKAGIFRREAPVIVFE